MFVAWHLETWSCQRQYSHWESLPDWQRKHQWNPNCQNQRHCRGYHRTKRSEDRSLEYVDINSWTSCAISIMAGGSWSNVLNSSEALVTYYILLLEVYVSHGFFRYCLEYILSASMNHMNGKVKHHLTNVWGTNMKSKNIKSKLEMNLRSVFGGFNPSEKLSSVKQKVIPSTCSVPMKGQIRGSFGGAPHVIIWLTFWGTHATSDESSGVLVQYLLVGPPKSWNGIFKILITTNCSMKFDRKVTPGSTHVVYQPINPAVVFFRFNPLDQLTADLHSSKAYSPRLHQIQRDPKRNLCLRILFMGNLWGPWDARSPPISPA